MSESKSRAFRRAAKSGDHKPIIHVTKFMDGRETPEEMHRRTAFGGNRCICGAPPAVRIRLFAPVADILRTNPQWAMTEAAKHGGKLPVVEFTYGKFARISDVYACEGCRSTAEKQVAKAPSWVLVEIDAGPKGGVQMQVPRQYQKTEPDPKGAA